MIQNIDHINIVVNDLPHMQQFYTQALQLQITKHVNIHGKWIDQVVGLKDVRAEVIYLEAQAQATRIELIRYHHPHLPQPDTIDLSQPHLPGLRHLAFKVSHIESAADRVRNAGGKLLGDVQQVPDSQVTYQGGLRKRLVYFLDPERNLLELCSYE